jgi:hypothetical protein
MIALRKDQEGLFLFQKRTRFLESIGVFLHIDQSIPESENGDHFKSSKKIGNRFASEYVPPSNEIRITTRYRTYDQGIEQCILMIGCENHRALAGNMLQAINPKFAEVQGQTYPEMDL